MERDMQMGPAGEREVLEAGGPRRRRSRRRKKGGTVRRAVKVFFLLLMCVILCGAGWGIVRFGQEMARDDRPAAVETAREVIPETFPQDGAETFQ